MSESKTAIEPIETLVERDLSGWAKFIWNCADGSNYFRYSEYCDLIRTLDRYASDLAVALAERDAAKAELKSLLEEPFFREHQHALHRAMVAEAERDALAARVAEPCAWMQDGEGNYWTDCGQGHTFIDGGPTENSMKFCCYCGKTLKAALSREEPTETETGKDGIWPMKDWS